MLIPGTKRRTYLHDNFGALEVTLDVADLARIDALMPPSAASGTRYTAAGMQTVNR